MQSGLVLIGQVTLYANEMLCCDRSMIEVVCCSVEDYITLPQTCMAGYSLLVQAARPLHQVGPIGEPISYKRVAYCGLRGIGLC